MLMLLKRYFIHSFLFVLFQSAFNFKSSGSRDVFIQGACDDGVMKLAEALGWKDELLKLANERKNKNSTTASVDK